MEKRSSIDQGSFEVGIRMDQNEWARKGRVDEIRAL